MVQQAWCWYAQQQHAACSTCIPGLHPQFWQTLPCCLFSCIVCTGSTCEACISCLSAVVWRCLGEGDALQT